MSRPEFDAMANPSPLGTGNGTPIKVDRFRDKTVQIAGTFSATINIQGSVDGTNYVTVDNGTFTAPGIVEIFPSFQYLRVNFSGYVSGTPSITFGGFDERAI